MKERLDVLLVKRNLAESREKAKAVIMSGIVYVDGQKEDKAGSMFDETANVEVRGTTLKYVSRGGLKLEKAMTHFGVTLEGKICMDVGASTGGFTDCMLQHGAKKVYSIDVGYGQLDWRLRNDERVKVMERMNARNMTSDWFDEEVDFASMDVSFISIKLILPAIYNCLKNGALAVILVKPQFEAGKDKVGKKGVVRDPAVHAEVLREFLHYAPECGFGVRGLEFSPIRGPEGNIEYLAWLKKGAEGIPETDIDSIVAASHAARGKDSEQ